MKKVLMVESGCWLWIAAQSSDGYGSFSSSKLSECRAHRASWVLFNGLIPDGEWVLHTCDVPLCVNPEHLFLGDHTANMRDMIAKGRRKAPDNRGERHGSAKLTEDDVIAIRRLVSDGQSQYSLAKHYDVDSSLINGIVHRRYWTHV